MIFPIRAYGDPILRKKAQLVPPDITDLTQLVADMFETMYASNGVGLAAPQIGRDLRLFIIDTNAFEDKKIKGIKKTFINASVLNEIGDEWEFEEGCLSIPKIREGVKRKPELTIKFQDENFNWTQETFTGMPARVIQHEYDHIEGILFVDHLSSFKKQLIKGKLNSISKGKVDVDYKMKFYTGR